MALSALFLLALSPALSVASGYCNTRSTSKMVKFSNATYYYTYKQYSKSTALSGCPGYFGEGHSYPTYVPGMETELELMRLLFVFKSER